MSTVEPIVLAPQQTIIVSDMHLADAEPVDPKRPHWKAYKQRRNFFDADFANLLQHVRASATGSCELVLNGDTVQILLPTSQV